MKAGGKKFEKINAPIYRADGFSKPTFKLNRCRGHLSTSDSSGFEYVVIYDTSVFIYIHYSATNPRIGNSLISLVSFRRQQTLPRFQNRFYNKPFPLASLEMGNDWLNLVDK